MPSAKSAIIAATMRHGNGSGGAAAPSTAASTAAAGSPRGTSWIDSPHFTQKSHFDLFRVPQLGQTRKSACFILSFRLHPAGHRTKGDFTTGPSPPEGRRALLVRSAADGGAGLQAVDDDLTAAALVGRIRRRGSRRRCRRTIDARSAAHAGLARHLALVEHDLAHGTADGVDPRPLEEDLALAGAHAVVAVEVVHGGPAHRAHGEEHAVEGGPAIASGDVLVVEDGPDEERAAEAVRVEGGRGLGRAPEAGELVLQVETEEARRAQAGVHVAAVVAKSDESEVARGLDPAVVARLVVDVRLAVDVEERHRVRDGLVGIVPETGGRGRHAAAAPRRRRGAVRVHLHHVETRAAG